MVQLPKLDLNITNRCNYRCVHCAFDSGVQEIQEMTLDDIKRILLQTKELGGKKFDITGGEPTLRKDIGEIITFGKKLDYKIELVTNGSLITSKQLKGYRKNGLDGVAISLDGSNYKGYSQIRRCGVTEYKHVLETITKCVNLGFYTKVNTVAFESNLKDIPNIVRKSISIGVDEIGIYYFTPVGRGNKTIEKSCDPIVYLRELRQNVASLKDKIKISVETPILEKELVKKELGCILESDPYHLQILPDQKVYPCAIMASYGRPIADLSRKSAKAVWENRELWKRYLERSKDCFSDGHCFRHEFSAGENFVPICPLRKFSIEEVCYD